MFEVVSACGTVGLTRGITSSLNTAGRIIVNVVNKVMYVLHVSYPRGLADTFADGVYNKIRHSMKLTN